MGVTVAVLTYNNYVSGISLTLFRTNRIKSLLCTCKKIVLRYEIARYILLVVFG
jgi:hypothetical protein